MPSRRPTPAAHAAPRTKRVVYDVYAHREGETPVVRITALTASAGYSFMRKAQSVGLRAMYRPRLLS